MWRRWQMNTSTTQVWTGLGLLALLAGTVSPAFGGSRGEGRPGGADGNGCRGAGLEGVVFIALGDGGTFGDGEGSGAFGGTGTYDRRRDGSSGAGGTVFLAASGRGGWQTEGAGRGIDLTGRSGDGAQGRGKGGDGFSGGGTVLRVALGGYGDRGGGIQARGFSGARPGIEAGGGSGGRGSGTTGKGTAGVTGLGDYGGPGSGAVAAAGGLFGLSRSGGGAGPEAGASGMNGQLG
jgi:hypothetical protein